MSRAVLVASVALVLVALALASTRVFPEGADSSLRIGKGWALIRSERFDKNAEQRDFIVAIKQQNRELLEETFWAVSDPASPRYGQYLTIDQLTEMIAPSDKAVSTVVSWLEKHGCQSLSLTMNRDFVRARASLATLERMFHVTFHTFRHRDAFDMPVRATLEAYSMPAEVAQHVDLVSHITGLPDVHLPRKAKAAPQASNLDITPSVIWQRYNISGWTAKAQSNSQAVAEFQAQFYSPTDLSTFFQKFVPNSNADQVYKVIGTNNAAKPGDEASLDIQYLMGVAPGVQTWFYSQAQFNFYNDLVNWLTILSNQTDAPWVHSVSYGSQGNYPTATYQQRSDAEYQKVCVCVHHKYLYLPPIFTLLLLVVVVVTQSHRMTDCNFVCVCVCVCSARCPWYHHHLRLG
jgi:tripeptidyl-peptidase I